jgi:hypothetical protein
MALGALSLLEPCAQGKPEGFVAARATQKPILAKNPELHAARRARKRIESLFFLLWQRPARFPLLWDVFVYRERNGDAWDDGGYETHLDGTRPAQVQMPDVLVDDLLDQNFNFVLTAFIAEHLA